MKGLTRDFFKEVSKETDSSLYEKWGISIGFGPEVVENDSVLIEETNYEIKKETLKKYPFKFEKDEHVQTFKQSSFHPGAKHVLLKEGLYKKKKRTDRMIKRSAAFYVELVMIRDLDPGDVYSINEEGELDIILKGCYGETDLLHLRLIECMIVGFDSEKNIHYLDYDLKEGFCQADEVR